LLIDQRRRCSAAFSNRASPAHGTAEQAVALAVDTFGRLDILVNNAGRILYSYVGQHPWLIQSKHVSPAKKYQIAGLADGLQYYNSTMVRDDIPIRHPLLSQPIIEMCLRIPVFGHVPGKIDRELARREFADSLPPEILQRSWKGTAAAFRNDFLRKEKRKIFDRVLDGALCARSIVDKRKVTELRKQKRTHRREP
jgi:asparagine synthase (glutamine-hydrolysing)